MSSASVLTLTITRVMAGLVALATLAGAAAGGGGLAPAPAAALASVPAGAVRAGDDGVGGVEFAPDPLPRAPNKTTPEPRLTLAATAGGAPGLRLEGAPPGAAVVIGLALVQLDAPAPAPHAAQAVLGAASDAAGALDLPLDGLDLLQPGEALVVTAWVAGPGGPLPTAALVVAPPIDAR